MSAKRRNARLMAVLAVGAVAAMVAVVVLRGPPAPLPAAGDVFELLPARCDEVFVAPDPGRLGEHLAALARLKLVEAAASLGGYQSAESLVADLARQIGWDPRSPESMRAVGLDPSRPLVGLTSGRGAALLAVPALDGQRLEALVARHAGGRLGAPVRSERRVGPWTLVQFSAEGQQAPALVLAQVQRYTLLAQGTAGVALLEATLAQKPESSLARNPEFAALKDRLAAHDLIAIACPTPASATPASATPASATPASATALPPGTFLAATFDGAGLRLAGELPLTPAQATQFASLALPAGADLQDRLDPSAFLVARLGGDPALLAPLLDLVLPAALQQALQAGGVDPKQQILGGLKPGLALSLSLAPEISLAGGVPALDPRRTNPFQYLFLNALGRVADPARGAATLEAVAAAAPSFGARLEEQSIQGTKVYVTRYRLGEGASLALRGDVVACTGGTGQMGALLARLQAAPPPTGGTPESQAQRADAVALSLDIGRATSGVRAIPDAAYGLGGFAIRSAVLRWLDAVDELGALRVNGRLQGHTVQAEASLTLRKPALGGTAP